MRPPGVGFLYSVMIESVDALRNRLVTKRGPRGDEGTHTLPPREGRGRSPKSPEGRLGFWQRPGTTQAAASASVRPQAPTKMGTLFKFAKGFAATLCVQ